jgi:hypothetical protein
LVAQFRYAPSTANLEVAVKETVAYCDLDEKSARRPGVAVVNVVIDGTSHALDVCQPHLTLLSRLPATGATGRGRRAGKAAPAAPVPRTTAKKSASAAKTAPGKRAAKAASPAKRVGAAKAVTAAPRNARTPQAATGGRTPGSRRDQQQRVAAARQWARAQGRTIAGKGRLPAGLLDEFDAANS